MSVASPRARTVRGRRSVASEKPEPCMYQWSVLCPFRSNTHVGRKVERDGVEAGERLRAPIDKLLVTKCEESCDEAQLPHAGNTCVARSASTAYCAANFDLTFGLRADSSFAEYCTDSSSIELTTQQQCLGTVW